MELYLMQHGAAYAEAEDAARPLSPAGVAQVKASGRGIRTLGLTFDLIIASPRRRAQQTAALLAEAVRYPYSDILSSDGLLPKQEPGGVQDLLRKEAADSKILVVGHLPNLQVLASELMQGGQLLFGNAGLVALRDDGTGRYCLTFLLTAEQLALLQR